MISCILIDDQEESISLLCQYAEKIPNLHVAYASSSALDGLSFLSNHPVDVVFLDVEMPECNGIEFVEMLQERFGDQAPMVVFTTAYPKYAIEGFDYDIVDFLTKPVFFPRFMKTLQRIEKKIAKRKKRKDHLFVDCQGAKQKVWLNQILFVKSDGNYLYITTTEDTYHVYGSLQEMGQQLPKKAFVRIHKSYIVATDKIVNYSGKVVRLADYSHEIPVGSSFRSAFEATMNFNQA